MTLREYFLQRQKSEAPVFLRVLKALPKDQIEYKPHERSPSAAQLAWTITAETKICLDVIAASKAEWKSIPPPSIDEMVEQYERYSTELTESVARMDDAAW